MVENIYLDLLTLFI